MSKHQADQKAQANSLLLHLTRIQLGYTFMVSEGVLLLGNPHLCMEIPMGHGVCDVKWNQRLGYNSLTIFV